MKENIMKRKILQIGIAAMLCGFMAACSSTIGTNSDVKTADFQYFTPKHSLKEVYSAIIKAGQEDGWRMTEFKDNKLIAEKISNSDTEAVTIEFSTDYFHIIPANDDLEEAILQELSQ
jgi:hypothetical protein